MIVAPIPITIKADGPTKYVYKLKHAIRKLPGMATVTDGRVSAGRAK